MAHTHQRPRLRTAPVGADTHRPLQETRAWLEEAVRPPVLPPLQAWPRRTCCTQRPTPEASIRSSGTASCVCLESLNFWGVYRKTTLQKAKASIWSRTDAG